MTQQHPVIERYMTHLETAIVRLDPVDRREVLQEIRNHIAEATAAGRSLDVVLESLGPADALGRAYAVELLLHPQNDRPRHAAERWFRLVGLVVVLTIPTIVAVSTLVSVGISFVAGGLFAFVIGVLEALGIFPWPDLSDVPPGRGHLSRAGDGPRWGGRARGAQVLRSFCRASSADCSGAC